MYNKYRECKIKYDCNNKGRMGSGKNGGGKICLLCETLSVLYVF